MGKERRPPVVSKNTNDSGLLVTLEPTSDGDGCLRCLLLVMCTYPFSKKHLRSIYRAAKVVSAILAVI